MNVHTAKEDVATAMLVYVTAPDGQRLLDPFVLQEILENAARAVRNKLKGTLPGVLPGDTIKLTYTLKIIYAPDVQD